MNLPTTKSSSAFKRMTLDGLPVMTESHVMFNLCSAHV